MVVMLNAAVKWLDIHLRVKQMIRSVFEAAATMHPEMHSSTSRAMYGVDVMLDCNYQPKLLEVGKALTFFSFGNKSIIYLLMKKEK